MPCLRPNNIRRKQYYHDLHDTKMMQVPCGRCSECYASHQRELYVRSKYELKRATSAHFFTLTYADAPITPNGRHFTADKTHIKKFMTRLRHLESTRQPIGELLKNGKRRIKKVWNEQLKFLYVLEYGTKHQRPHYHFLMFNLKNIQNVYRAWSINKKPIGRIDVGKVENASINYVVGYIGKRIGIPTTPDDQRLPEYRENSQKFGDGFLETTGKWNKKYEEGYTVLDGITYKLPRYLKNKLFPLYKAQKIDKFGNKITTTTQHPISRAIGKKALHNYHKIQQQQIKHAGSEQLYYKNLHEHSIQKNNSKSKLTPLS